MLTISADLEAVYGTGNWSDWFRVRIDRGSGDWVDMSALEGKDWQIDCEISERVDSSGKEATITLLLSFGKELSLSPLMTGSKVNANGTIIQYNNPVSIEVCSTPLYQEPAESSWVELFRGTIREFQVSGDQIVLECMDQVAALITTVMQTQEPYGSTAGQLAEDAIQDMLDDHMGMGNVTLYSENGTKATPFNTSDSPGFVMDSYLQQKMSVYAGVRAIVNNFGWDIRYKLNTDSSDSYELTLYEPDRSKSVPDRTFGTDRFSVGFGIDGSTIVNKWKGAYYTSGVRQPPITVSDTASIATYGEQYAEIQEAMGSQIDSSGEMTTFLNTALTDTKDPTADVTLRLKQLFWPVELGDLYRVSALKPMFDSDLDLAVQSYSHHFESDGASYTVLMLHGKPSMGRERWLGARAQPGQGLEMDVGTPAAPDNVVATAGLSSLIVTYDHPHVMKPPIWDWSYTEVHVSDSGSGFTPSASTLKGKGKQTRFEVVDLVPGTQYWTKVRLVDAAENIGTASSAVTTTTEYVDAYSTNNDSVPSRNEHPNYNFGVWPQSGL